jgi:hypothetical protein
MEAKLKAAVELFDWLCVEVYDRLCNWWQFIKDGCA